jgi:hypothetical protein
MTIGELNTDAKVRLNLDDLKSYATYWIRSFRVNWYGWGATPHEVHLQLLGNLLPQLVDFAIPVLLIQLEKQRYAVLKSPL